MLENTQPRQTILSRVLLVLFFVAAGSLIILVFSPWRPLLERRADYYGRILMLGFFALLNIFVRRNARLAQYSQVVLGLFILALTFTLDWIFGRYYFDTLKFNDSTPAEWAAVKVNEFVVVWVVVIAATLCTGAPLSSLLLQKGRLKLGLLIGGTCFLVFLLSGIPVATVLFQGKDLTVAKVLPWMPWVLIYCFANGANEELMFRGLFLPKLEPFIGKFPSNLLIALVFTLIHYGATYTSSQLMFLVVTFPLALLLGYLAQKTNALWASILLHAGMDIPVMLGIFSNL